MRKLLFVNTEPPPGAEGVEDFERRWELKLPASFKDFCREYNGGMPAQENCYFHVDPRFEKFHGEYGPSGQTGVGVAEFFALAPGGQQGSLESLMSLLVRTNQLPANRVPIAGEGCGNDITLSVAKEDFGTVFYWARDLGGEEFPIADSFEDFLEGLTFMPDDPEVEL